MLTENQFYCRKNTRANPEISSSKVLLSVCLLVYFTAEVFGKDLRPLLGSAFLVGTVAFLAGTNTLLPSCPVTQTPPSLSAVRW